MILSVFFFFFGFSSKKYNESSSYSCLVQFKTQTFLAVKFKNCNLRYCSKLVLQISFLSEEICPALSFCNSQTCAHLRCQKRKGTSLKSMEWLVGRTCFIHKFSLCYISSLMSLPRLVSGTKDACCSHSLRLVR